MTAGKSEIGEITVALAHEGNEIILSMADDGRGLDRERIRARAVEMGLLEPGMEADDGLLYDLIFRPGFSTAGEVSQLAGRGVGMDVVKTEVGELGGRIEILSQPGHGTTFRLYLPLTLAVTQTLSDACRFEYLCRAVDDDRAGSGIQGGASFRGASEGRDRVEG